MNNTLENISLYKNVVHKISLMKIHCCKLHAYLMPGSEGEGDTTYLMPGSEGEGDTTYLMPGSEGELRYYIPDARL